MEDEVGEILGGEDQVGAERYILARHLCLQLLEPDARGEPALLVIFAVIGQEALRQRAQDLAARDGEGAIVEPPVAPERRADDKHGPEVRALLRQPRSRLDRVRKGPAGTDRRPRRRRCQLGNTASRRAGAASRASVSVSETFKATSPAGAGAGGGDADEAVRWMAPNGGRAGLGASLPSSPSCQPSPSKHLRQHRAGGL